MEADELLEEDDDILESGILDLDEVNEDDEPKPEQRRTVYQRPDYWASEWGRLLRSGK